MRWLEQLHKEDRFDEIIKYVLSLPRDSITYEIAGRLASAYNNTEQYDKALSVLDEWRAQGESDFLWHYRRGYAYFFLTDYESAEKAFGKALELDKDDCDCLYFLALIYGSVKNDKITYEKVLSRLKELNPELYRAEFGATDNDDAQQPENERTKSYNDLWLELASPAVKKWYEVESDWDVLTETEQQMVAIVLFTHEVCENGFLYFFCSKTDGYEAYSYAVKGARRCAEEPVPQDVEVCYVKAFSSVESMYRVIVPYIRRGIPFWDIPQRLKKSEKDELTAYEKMYKQNYGGLAVKLYTYFYNEQIVAVGRPFSTDYRLCYGMISEFPAIVTQRVRSLISRFIKWLEAGNRTYREVQQRLDKLTIAINRLKPFCEQNGCSLNETARYSIAETVEYVLRWFDVDIDIAFALRLREW